MKPVHTLFVAVFLAGCGPPIGSQSQTSSANATLPTAAAVKVVSGDGQSASAGSALPLPLVVIVLDKTGHTMQNVLVNFTVTAGSASLSAASPWTDSTGEAKTQVTLGSNPGVTTISAQISGLPPVDFQVLGTGSVAQVTVSSGDRQSAPAGAALAKPLVVEVDDSLGDPISGVAVTFTVTAGGGQLSATNVTTDANGLAKTSLTLGPASGLDVVSAAAGSLSTTFTETGLAATSTVGPPATIAAVSGTGQQATVRTTLAPFVVTVNDQNGNPVPGVLVSFTTSGGSLSASSASTGSQGQTSTTLTLGAIAGGYTVQATRSGLTGSPVVFTATATPSSASIVTAVSGNLQTGTVGTALPAPLVVLVSDALGNPVPQASVTFTVASGAATAAPVTTTTDASGQAATTLELGTVSGNVSVTASAGGTSALFVATALAGPPARLAFENAPAHAAAGVVLAPAPLVAVTDSYGNAVPQATNQVTMALAANASGATLSGTGVVSAVTGVATFSSLRIDRPGTGYVLQAGSAGLTSASSAAFDVGLASGPPSWLPGTNLSAVRSRLAAVTGSDGTTYALGGFATTVLGTAETLASVATAWQALAALPTPRAGLAAAPGGSGRVYAIGGELANGAASTANEVYDPATGAWTGAPSLPTARSGLGAAAASGAIYAVGGENALGIPVGALEAYSESANAWQSLAPMLTARTRLGVAVGPDGRLYAIGGATTSGASGVVEAYDPSLDAWIAVASLATAREGLAATAGPDGRIYAIGGRDAAGNLLATVEAYTPATNAWTVVANLVEAHADLAFAARLSGPLLAVGGTVASGPSARVNVYGPTATLSPGAGLPGTSVSVSATNLAPVANVSVYWGTTSGTILVQGKSDAAGACTLTFTVPLTATSGAPVVTVIDDAASYPTAASFNVP